MQSPNLENTPLSGIEYKRYPNRSTPPNNEDRILSSNSFVRGGLAANKYINAWTTYTIRGFSGSQNSNFYEFLSMGMIPYTIGSLMLIAMSNIVNHTLKPQDRLNASKFGLKAGLGVILYGLAKHFSKKLVEKPVKWATGIDVNLPYMRYSHDTPTQKNNDPVSAEGHYAFESIEFPRTDLLQNYQGGKDKANEYFDKIARKMGYSQKLPDSDQIVKPKIREVSTKTKTVTYLTQYLWAALGVAFAFQKPWEKLVKNDPSGNWIGSSFKETMKNFKKHFKLPKESDVDQIFLAMRDSAKELYNGSAIPNKYERFSGKALVWGTLLSTILGTGWIIASSKKKDKPISSKYAIDKSREYVVS